MDSGYGAVNAERSANQVACLRFLAGALTAQTVGVISAETGLSRPTVHAVLDDLVAAGLVVPSSTASGGPGRPARAFRFARDAGLVAGVDIGPRKARAVICDLSGERVGYAEFARAGRAADTSVVREAVEAAAKADGLDLSGLRAVGVGLAGVVEESGRLRASLALPELVGTPVADEVAADLGCVVVVDNDIKLAALAEQRGGAGRGHSDVLYLQIGNRLALSIVLDEEIRQGSHRLAGELGAQRGMRWTRNADRGQLVWQSHPTGEAVLQAAAGGDAAAVAELEDFCGQIAGRIASVLLTVDPDVVVVRFGSATGSTTLLRPLAAAIEKELLFPERPPFVAAALGREAVVLGAAGHAFDRFGANVFGLRNYPSPWNNLINANENEKRTSQ
ncbi:ROK family transcriptional regulator [Kribbella sandramycini]|uniref:Putative NBD/HSP70 family sugar kinase n=1 Tax=Kribbella sandramycini TaxID=60450 RepID=A0A7Y4L0B0_9ACTN|nr:ROK family transcriptional regulator [Kribbella sandramycini]MBB6569193.1 putative NBD/HSP70 family sugar kinase [Kribbella sandramycini]NOL40966.1 ROK family transcriptional regulator [Kribbella sandramycini]